jgi:hypothetical protein
VSTPELGNFARLLMQEVRDPAIRSCDRQLEPGAQTPIGVRWAKAASTSTPRDAARAVIPDCADEVIFYLLRAIDQGLLRLSYTDETGAVVDLRDEGLGELSGWFMGSGGWRAQYSAQRFNDDFADLQ